MSCDPCTPENACAKISCLEQNLKTIWDDFYGEPESTWLFTGNIGIPTNGVDILPLDDRTTFDAHEYMRGSQVINSQPYNGLFLVGDSNYDYIQMPVFGAPVNYDIFRQEAKMSNAFGLAIAQRKLFPVYGRYDWWAPACFFQSGLPDVPTMQAAVDKYSHTRFVKYLPDAKRYYSVYDAATLTEFFVLSAGRSANYHDQMGINISEIIFNDLSTLDSQYAWFTSRIKNTPAKNKVVIFADPFVGVYDIYNGDPSTPLLTQTELHIKDDWWEGWDFEGLGVNLIINGHLGGSTHLSRRNMHVVNASAFSRSRMGAISMAFPGGMENTFGQSGWAVEYSSALNADGRPVTNTAVGGAGSVVIPYLVPKNEYFRLKAYKGRLVGEFVSYDPYIEDDPISNFETPISSPMAVIDSQKVEHTFEITN